MKSDQINELAAALSKAQGEIEAATKNAQNPHFKNRYADLAAVWDACRTPLSKNGLSVIQTVGQDEGGFVLNTTLCHASGQWIESQMHLILSKQDMQGLGSALTYARRYSLAAMIGIAQEDDDADGAVNPSSEDDERTPLQTYAGAPMAAGTAKGGTCSKCGTHKVQSSKNPNNWYCSPCWKAQTRTA